MGSKRSSHTATRLSNGSVLIVGGYDGSGELDTAELYDPVAGDFTDTGSMNSARSLHSATLLPGGRVLLAGGYDGTTDTASAELY